MVHVEAFRRSQQTHAQVSWDRLRHPSLTLVLFVQCEPRRMMTWWLLAQVRCLRLSSLMKLPVSICSLKRRGSKTCLVKCFCAFSSSCRAAPLTEPICVSGLGFKYRCNALFSSTGATFTFFDFGVGPSSGSCFLFFSLVDFFFFSFSPTTSG